ncbi:MAG: hypothetical protein QGI41_08390 [Acidimicrobiales bacterium]|nr:hypothetical protein [Acidimicrobiales bacterium]MDP6214941.1 hypothetical protein [Acidimicrobiales bacterium]MDP7209607.1 hypothetical protein [Acidimicrobiales bacterium]HJO98272.1 hypothetical protein [Acidimicrobiales bacterium]
MRRRGPIGDLGQILPLVLLMVALGAAMALLVAELGVIAVDRARARSAAVLAAATERGDGRTVAREFASANGAQLESFEHAGGEVLVVVSVGRARATARAVAVLCKQGEPCGRFTEP